LVLRAPVRLIDLPLTATHGFSRFRVCLFADQTRRVRGVTDGRRSVDE